MPPTDTASDAADPCSITARVRAAEPAWLNSLSADPFVERSKRAIWLQIYDRFRRSIEAGDPGAGVQLPGEHQIAAALKVNRITLRRAWSRLQREGYLSARKGVGVFVRRQPTLYTVTENRGFLANVDGDPREFAVRTLSLGLTQPDPETADQLRIDPSATVVRLERMRLRLEQPIYRTEKVFPAARFPRFEEVYAPGSSVGAVFRAHGVERFTRSRTRVSGGFATGSEAADLDLTPTTPVLRTVATVVDENGIPIEHSRGCWPLTMVELIFE